MRFSGAVRPDAVWSYDFIYDQMLIGAGRNCCFASSTNLPRSASTSKRGLVFVRRT